MWDPFKDINKRFSEFTGTGYKKPYSNITQNPRFVVINIELPEIKRRNILLEVTDDKVVVMAKNSSKKVKARRGSYLEVDKSYGFYRSITLPKGLSVDETEAKFIGKVLKIRIPKRRTYKKVSIR